MIGIGYDVHRFASGRPLILGGVTIPHPLGLIGHSDADALSHAIADAVLGAMGQPDIGHFFPPDDPACAGICSLEILAKCRELLDAMDYEIVNIDTTVIAEAPKILPHREAMRKAIGEALGLSPERIGIKATTHETMGAFGRGEGIAAIAVAQIEGRIDCPF